MARIFQVEYMTRPDEREHIEQFDDFREACTRAREMSDRYDGDAVLCALDPMPCCGGIPGYDCAHDPDPEKLRVTGHIEFVFGMPREQTGTLENVDIPRGSRRK